MDKHAVEEIFRSIKSTYNYQYDLNTKQLKVISSILSGRNTFCVLPTGFGKSDSVKCCDVTALVAIGNYQNNMASI